jgi:hypothetical protein
LHDMQVCFCSIIDRIKEPFINITVLIRAFLFLIDV